MKNIFALFAIICLIGVSTIDYAAPPNDIGNVTATTDDTIKADKVETVINQIETVLPIPADTVNSIDEIVETGTYFVKTVPPKGSPWTDYVKYAFAALGYVFAVVIFLKKKKTGK